MNIPFLIAALMLAPAASQASVLGEAYTKAQEIMKPVSAARASSVKSGKGRQAVSASPREPVELLRESFQNGRDGVSFDDARSLCEAHRRLNEGAYFYVYCVFHEKNWTEIRVGHATYTDYRFLGYVTQSESRSVHVSGRSSTLWGLYDRSNSITLSESAYSQSPVIAAVEVPYQYEYAVDKKIYGLKVMGLGPIDAATPWTEIESSARLGAGVELATFASERDALIACNEVLLAVKMDPRYHRSRCAVSRTKEGAVVYTVLSQNPFLRAS